MSSSMRIASPKYNTPTKNTTLAYNVSPVIKKNLNKQKKTYSDICDEYELMRNYFDPRDRSPNLFMNKLEYRMKQYYSHCIKHNNLKRLKKKCIK